MDMVDLGYESDSNDSYIETENIETTSTVADSDSGTRTSVSDLIRRLESRIETESKGGSVITEEVSKETIEKDGKMVEVTKTKRSTTT